MNKLSTWQEMASHFKFPVPQSISAAEEEYALIISEIQSIEAQLGDRLKRSEAHTNGTIVLYHEWRQKAVRAKNIKSCERRFIKLWLQERKRVDVSSLLEVDQNDPKSLLVAAYTLFTQLSNEGIEFNQQESALIAAIHSFCGRSSAPV